MAWPCGRHSHPPSSGRVFFTRPSTDCHAIVYPGHATCPGRWRALSEVPFGRSPGRNKLRSQAAGQDMQFYASLERRQPPPPCPLLVCGSGEHRRSPALMPLRFWCARWASKRDQQPLCPYFLCANSARRNVRGSPREVKERTAKASHKITSQGCRKTLSGTSSP